MKNKVIVLLFLLTSIISVSYVVAADLSESDSKLADSAGSDETNSEKGQACRSYNRKKTGNAANADFASSKGLNLGLRQALELCKKGQYGDATKVICDVPKENLSANELKIAIKIMEEAKLQARSAKDKKESLKDAVTSFFSGDYDRTRKIFVSMSPEVRAQLPDIFLTMEKMLDLSSIDIDQEQDFKPKLEELYQLIQNQRWVAAAPIFIRFRKSYPVEWPKSYQKAALVAVRARAEYEKSKAQLIKAHREGKGNKESLNKKINQ
jgi:hypothetical protein